MRRLSASNRFAKLLVSVSAVVVTLVPAFAWGADADLAVTVNRPLRYHPEGGDFVIENGEHWFNRPLYGPHTAFHVDGGDKPEFAFVNTATKDGVLRLALITDAGKKWLTDAAQITTRYRPGSLIYQIRDPLLGEESLRITVESVPDAEGIILRAEFSGNATTAQLAAVFGGVASLRRANGNLTAGDVITPQNVSAIRAIDENNGRDLRQQLMLTPEQCAGDKITLSATGFQVDSASDKMIGRVEPGATLSVGDASKMWAVDSLLGFPGDAQPLVIARLSLSHVEYLSVVRANAKFPASGASGEVAAGDLAKQFDAAEAARIVIADAITVDTPDPFINAIPAAMAIGANGCWQSPTWMHGAVSWRTALLGWRGSYMGDALGWHDRADAYFNYWAGRQNTADDFPTVAVPNPARGLAENDGKMLHSNGSIPQTHYDMNMVYFDALFRHFLWTGDLDEARKFWPVIQRDLAWEKRLFDRDGLYEGYAAIWASDALQYNGGGAAHSTAYIEFANRMAARIGHLIGEDAAPYEKETDRIHEAMQSKLWLGDRGWYAEYLDVMGEKQLHTAAALWSVYHPIDSRVPDSFEAWQLLRYVDTQIAHIPVRGTGVPAGDYHVLPESNWMPYEWSLNNVVTGENTHTALAYWEGGRPAEGFNLFKSTMLDTMYLGMTPGNLPNLSAYDPYRGESYTDFGDPTGITSRAFVEGLFGIRPDALDGEVLIRPGFPMEWDHATINTHDLAYSFKLQDRTETWSVDMKFPKPMRLRLQIPARGDKVDSVQVNGKPVEFTVVTQSVGEPWIEIAASEAAAHYDVTIKWAGDAPATMSTTPSVAEDGTITAKLSAGTLVDVSDPQKTLGEVQKQSDSLTARAVGTIGHRTAFVAVKQGDLAWWLPVEFEITSAAPAVAAGGQEMLTWQSRFPTDTHWEEIDLSGVLNDKVTAIFRNEYLTPRPQTCSLQMPIHGIGDWTGPTKTFNVDDRGLRKAAGSKGILTLPQGIPFKTPGDAGAKNIAFTSQYDNYPRQITQPLSGKGSHAFFLLAGSTNAMESQIDNGELVVTYADDSTTRLPLHNPTNWWPIDKDYRVDDYAFKRPEALPIRVELGTGAAYSPDREAKPQGGAATVADMPLDSQKELKSVTLHTESYELAIGLMSVTLERP